MEFAEKIREMFQIWRLSATPAKLTLDRMRLYPFAFIAANRDGCKLKLKPRCGEWFTFLENLCRADYLKHGIKLGPGDCVVDLGANIGAFTVLAANIVGQSGRVYAYEPNPEAFIRLQENVNLNNLQNVECYNEAVCDCNGMIDFYCCNKTAHSTHYCKIDGRDNTNNRKISIKSTSIMDVIKRVPGSIDLMKIDVEGAEYCIISEFTKDTLKSIRQLAMEIHNIDGIDCSSIGVLLKEIGYHTKDTYPFVAFQAISE